MKFFPIITFLVILLPYHGWTQNEKKNCFSTILDSNLSVEIPNVILLGEFHGHRNWEEKLALILALQDSDKSFDVLLELPFIFEPLLNNYLKTGDSTVFNFLKHSTSYIDEKKMMSKLHDLSSSSNAEIVARCFDISYFQFYETMGVMKLLFNDSIISDKLPIMDHFLFQKKYTRYTGNRKAIKILEKLQKDIELNKDKYKMVLQNDYEFYLTALESIYLSLGPNRKKEDKVLFFRSRERFIYEQISKIVVESNSQNHLIFTGNSHASKLVNDNLNSTNIDTSFTVRIINDGSCNVVSIMTIYLKEPWYFKTKGEKTLLDLINVTEQELIKLLGNEKNRLLKSEIFGVKNRCDYILIKFGDG